MTPEEFEESRRKAVKLLGEDHVRSIETQGALLAKEERFLRRWAWLMDLPVIGRFINAWWKTRLDIRLRTVIPFQCNHCGETLYAPSEEEMEIMMEKHLHKSHPEETRRELSPLERAFSEQSRKSQ
jgi:hypothetical protein